MSRLFLGAPRCFSTLRCRSTTTSLSAPAILPRYRPNAAALLRNYRGTPLGRITPVSRESLREIPSSGSRLEDGSIDVHPRLKPSLLRPVLFAVASSTLAYTFAAADTNEDTEELAELASNNSSIFSRGIRSVDLALQRRNEVLEDAKATLKALLGPSPDTRKFTTRIATISAEWWINKSEAQRTCLGLIGVQAVVFALWRVCPRFLRKTFMHHPLSGRSYTMLTSTFSHSTPLHFLFNSVAFYSFGPSAMQYLWSPNREGSQGMLESTSRYHFLALFVTAGIMSSLVSHCYTLLYVLPRALTSAAARSAIAPSHGASGSIYATIVITALAFPDAQVSLIILPMFPFSIKAGVASAVAFDVLGLLSARVRMFVFSRLGVMFDHAGHLGGALSGYLAYYYSGPIFDRLRRWLSDTPEETQQKKKTKPIRLM